MWRTREESIRQLAERGGRNNKTGWFEKLGYKNTINMPASLNGELMEKVSRALKNSTAPMGFKTLVMEDGGRSKKSDIVRSNPFPVEGGCERLNCVMCSIEPSKGKCWVSNCVYTIVCNRSPCIDGGALPTYVGETSRSIKTRGDQHMTLYRNKKDNSFLWKHTKEEHQGVIGQNDYKMVPLERCKEPLGRVLTEAVHIQKNEEDPKTISLNSKMEYFGSEMVRPSFSKGPADQW